MASSDEILYASEDYDVCIDHRSQCEHVAKHIIVTHIASHFYDACTADVFEIEMCSKSVRITLTW